ncbi:AlpA family transcriptional regulator [Sinomonas atrocyanea]|jgi:predicted DNA-binding transcriptional regulator AlpA|uniref:helix-turn-helix transcriptional regulator n=1 Tax=Sinomonas atrocyanea TaxID=37927 RepID=UPI0027809D10|nr:helix-turn-helix domain-containing protein [Sinomonas atrocyanea]MDQ0261725.1 putative DNA-binding transcriptional regulator AlpA [Sinomonas atrocyanea]MDR6623423.1 putative DNA-binding transcriptional regulator AlpA [Sinomonas atrocyanea]
MEKSTRRLESSADQGMPEQYLTTDQVAAWLQIAPKTLRNWRSAGLGPPAIKIYGHVRYSRATVEAWVAATAEVA